MRSTIDLARLALLAPLVVLACAANEARGVPEILLFSGVGTSANDVAAVERILKGKHLEYATANSSQLNGLSETQLMSSRLMIIPGGDFIAMGNSLTRATTASIHNAVQRGMNYLGICAGGFLAGAGAYNSLNLSSGVRFEFYSAVNRGVHKAAVPITSIDAPALEHYWEDGPHFAGWGAVVGRYPDGTSATVEGASGNGWVILTGVHPEAPQNWRRGMTFTTPASVDNAYAGTLIDAALNRTLLAHY